MGMRTKLMTGLLASALSLGGGAALAQDASPSSSPDTGPAASPMAGQQDLTHINIANPGGDIVAVASFTEDDRGVTIQITNSGDSGLEPGEHGVHIHEFGVCDASGEKPYMSAGDHFNPDMQEHGAPDTPESHAGDLGNLTVQDDGSIEFEVTTTKLTLEPGAANSLDDDDGSSILIHADEDDLESQPAGDSGAREACGIIFPATEPGTGMPAGTPIASPGVEMDEATPAS